jgi:uncharacterized protein (DUF1330 family)
MTAYVLAQLSIHDPQRYAAYATSFLETLSPYDGRLLVADERPDVVGGEWPHHKVVLLAFPSRGDADRWASSPVYQRIAIDREASTDAVVLVLRGIEPAPRPGQRRSTTGSASSTPTGDDPTPGSRPRSASPSGTPRQS